MTTAYIGLGSNRGNGVRHLNHAKRLLQRIPRSRCQAFSPIYVSEPVNCPSSQSNYHNAVAALSTNLGPKAMHTQLRRIEKKIQKRTRQKNAPRFLDIDYLLHGAARLKHRKLVIPHPKMYQRAFVLYPLSDITADKTDFHATDKVKKALLHCQNQQLYKMNQP